LTVAYAPHSVDQAFQRFVVEWGGQIHFVPLEVRREISPASDVRAILRVLDVMKREGPFDVIHGHSAKGGAIARIAGYRTGVPTVYTPHSLIMSSPEISRRKAVVYTMLERVLGRWATSRIIAVSEDERKFILKLKLVPDDRVVLIENGIEDKDFECSPRGHVYEDATKTPLVFGATMRFSAQKAPGLLVEAFGRLEKALPQVPVRLVIAGGGELFDEVEEQVEAEGLSDKVSLLGWRADVGEVLSGLDVFVLPSFYEGFSYAILEAMAAGLPLVSTDVFGTKETVARVPGNVLVPAGDPGALAEGMRKIATLAEPGLLRRALQEIGQRNRDHVRACFSRSEATRRTLELYEGLRLRDS
jgi:glycosyltransferase involved in cell wall biosynthesis